MRKRNGRLKAFYVGMLQIRGQKRSTINDKVLEGRQRGNDWRYAIR